jgi:hypothetical protein
MSVSHSIGTILPPGGLTTFPIDYNGCIILSCPARTLEYRQQEASAITTKASRPLPAILRLPSWSALPIIHQCISARVGYLARVSKLAANPAFLDFDYKIDAAILSIAGVTPRKAVSKFWLPTIRWFPLSLFGLGIPRFAGLAGETDCLLSREHSYDFFEQHHPSLLSSTRDQWPAIAMGQREKSSMQLDLSSVRSLDPELYPLFFGGGDTTLLHGDSDHPLGSASE